MSDEAREYQATIRKIRSESEGLRKRSEKLRDRLHDAGNEITLLRARVEVLERALRFIVLFCEDGYRQPFLDIATAGRAALKEAKP